jgi:predicted small integral membrane protein
MGTRDLTEATTSATARGDLLHQVAHIYSMTPDTVPYQNGKTYSYFAVTLIPRAIWPDKPETGSANNFFAVAYGVSTEEGVKTSTFGVSLLGEAFINFGWLGVVFVMLLQGIVLGLFEHMFAGPRSGPGGTAVFIAFFIFFLNGIGSSAEMMFGGVLQNLICGSALLWWARDNGVRSLVKTHLGRMPEPTKSPT